MQLRGSGDILKLIQNCIKKDFGFSFVFNNFANSKKNTEIIKKDSIWEERLSIEKPRN